MAASNELKALLGKYADDLATGQEQEQLFALITQSNDEDLQSSLTEMLAATQPHYNEQRRQRILDALLNRINSEHGVAVETGHKEHPSTGLRTGSGYTKNTAPVRSIWRWGAAAAIILMVVGGWWWIHETRGGQPGTPVVAQTHDVPAPSNIRAVITLADGSKVYLDSAGNGTIAQENNVAVVKNSNGEIVYNEGSKVSPVGGDLEGAYNTLYNPRGSKVISLTLSDGTKVWLNSESSLRYPASFAATAVREVEITGEAYFEVQHNAKQPFKVHLPNGGIVEDIGTAFNINSYADEGDIKTTLVEGSARVMLSGVEASTRNSVVLKPGQQAFSLLLATRYSLLALSISTR